ncbi:hypothetical protein BC832DRAFT_545860 [Gaertneriomyces semiglobifer]|nr:hypothetical protein BC832DRAFT_545860 [Gaertneriomyces semiglobifer]
MATPIRSRVLGAYRELLKAQRTTFAGDSLQLKNAKTFTRSKFLEQKDVTDPAELEKLVKVAQQSATIVRRNIVQGVKKTQEDDTYVLKLDENKEINSNDTIKQRGKGQPAQRVKLEAPTRCCSAG